MNRILKIGMDVHSTIYGIPGMAAGSAARDVRPAGCGFPVMGAAGAENVDVLLLRGHNVYINVRGGIH